MYFLIKGSVEVVLDDKHGVFAELKEGSFFGEHCVLGLSEHRPVSVRAMTWCNLFCLTQQALEDSIFTHPEVDTAPIHLRHTTHVGVCICLGFRV
jgi:CRP-like cAMP-binding protein